MRKSRDLWTPNFRHHSSMSDPSMSVIAYEHPHTDVLLSDIIVTNSSGRHFCAGSVGCKALFWNTDLKYYLLLNSLEKAGNLRC